MNTPYSTGDIRVDVTGGAIVSEGDGVHARYAMMRDRNGAIAVTVAEGAEVSGGRHGVYVGAAGLVEGNDDLRDQTVTVNGVVTGGTGAGVHLAGGGTVEVGSTGRVVASSGVGILSEGAGDLVVTVAGSGTVDGDIRAMDGGDLDATVSGMVDGDLRAEGGGALTVDVQEGGVVTGTVHDPAGPLTVVGSIGRVLYSNGGAVTVAGTGKLTGVEVEGGREAIRSEAGDLAVTVAGMVTGDVRGLGDGDLSATVAGTVKGDLIEEGAGDLDATISGTVEGDVLGRGTGEHTVTVSTGGTVTGTIHLAASTVTVDGTAGRVRFDNGGMVTVGSAGKLTGVEAEGGREAIRSEAGDLTLTLAGMVTGDVRGRGEGDLSATVAGTVRGDLIEEGPGDLSATVTGRVEGDVRAEGGGALTVDVKEGGTVTGTVRDPSGPLTVAGSIGRVLYGNGGAVTVAATGKLTGVEVEGGREAIRSEAGDLTLTLAGVVTGDVRGRGDGDLSAMVTGTVRGDIVEEGAGDLDATISGTVEGDVFGRGTGEHTVTVSDGGTVTGTIHLAASTVTVDGTAGRVRFDNGGMVTVGSAGKLTGVEVEDGTEAIRSEAGDLTLSLAGVVTGDVRGRGDGGLSAMVAGTVRGDIVEEGAGGLSARISGMVEGDVFGRGAGANRVTVSDGGTVRGTIDLAKGTVAVDGTAGRVRFGEDGEVVVSGTGRITGVEVEDGREAIRSEAGDLKVTLRARAGEAAEEAVKRINGRISPNPEEVCYAPAGEAPKCGSGGVVQLDGGGEIRFGDGGVTFGSAQWIRMMYEALPSALLGLNGLAGFEERMAAPRTEGGGWARMEAFRGKWKADASTTGGLEYDRRRQGLHVGRAVPVAENGLFGVSLHHRRGSADVSGGGEIDLSGNGGGVSGTWRGDDVYVDLQAEATWYEADFTSSRRGALKKDVSARGHALGVEVGRWFAMDAVAGGSVLTPRAALVHSRVSVGGFTDAVGSRVSVESGRSLKGRVGVSLETRPNEGSRVSGSLDVEHEFSDERKVRVSGTELASEAEGTRLRFGLNGSRASDDGRWTLAGGMSYYVASGGSHEVGGRLSLKMRF